MHEMNNATWIASHYQESAMALPDSSAAAAGGTMETEVTVSEDDETVHLIDSISSLSIISSSLSIISSSQLSYNHSASLAASLTRSQNLEAVVSYKLKSHESTPCLGYLQCQAQVSSLQEIPTELAMVSGKSIVYVVVDGSVSATSVGCGGMEAAADVFTHPLLNEALESLFIPVAVILPGNNSTASFVSRVGFLDESGQHVVPPILSSAPGCPAISKCTLGMAVIAALAAKHQPIPPYVAELANELDDGAATAALDHFRRRAWFGLEPQHMGTFEVALQQRQHPGIVSFQFGRLTGDHGFNVGDDEDHNGRLVVEIFYNAQLTSYGALVRWALLNGVMSSLPLALTEGDDDDENITSSTTSVLCQSNDERMAARLEVAKLSQQASCNDMSDDDEPPALFQASIEYIGSNGNSGAWRLEPFHPPLKALQETPLRFVPMTPRQAQHANRKIQGGRFDEAVQLLSPRQGLILLEATRRKGGGDFHDVTGLSFLEGWISASDRVAPVTRKKLRATDADTWMQC